MKMRGILESALYCEDLDVCERFYREVLGLERISAREGRHVFFRCGDGILLLFDPRTTSTVGTEVDGSPIPLHGATGEGHLAFRCTLSEIDGWRAHLEGHQVEIESEVTWPGGGRSIYFRETAWSSPHRSCGNPEVLPKAARGRLSSENSPVGSALRSMM